MIGGHAISAVQSVLGRIEEVGAVLRGDDPFIPCSFLELKRFGGPGTPTCVPVTMPVFSTLQSQE